MPNVGCAVCSSLTPIQTMELDIILADPLRWPATIWGEFDPPKGGLSPQYRRFGAIKMGEEWLRQYAPDFHITRGQLRRHIEFDVPPIGVGVEALLAKGLIAEGDGTTRSLTEAIDPLAYVRLFNSGVLLAEKGVDLLRQRLTDLEALGEEIPMPLLSKIIDTGVGLAKAQAAIVAKGQRLGEADAEDDAFRPKDVSPRMGHQRVHQIEGEGRPVRDVGQADRDHYNERARDEGSPTLGGR